jgi:predicted metal-dependent hydrolase
LEARNFADRNKDWLERELHRLAANPVRAIKWSLGTEIFFRGEKVKIESCANELTNTIRFGTEEIHTAGIEGDLRPLIERHLRLLAARELPLKVLALASQHGFILNRVSVKNQRSRWGSCSARGTISLNWRLIQTPVYVQDYLCLHELCHLRHMNHSHRFWSEVYRLCPFTDQAEQWLKRNSALLR